jgi:hypothetical protein
VSKTKELTWRLWGACQERMVTSVLEAASPGAHGLSFQRESSGATAIVIGTPIRLNRASGGAAQDKPKLQLGSATEESDYCTQFALKIFDKAEKQDRDGRATAATSKAYYAASVFLEVRALAATRVRVSGKDVRSMSLCHLDRTSALTHEVGNVTWCECGRSEFVALPCKHTTAGGRWHARPSACLRATHPPIHV